MLSEESVESVGAGLSGLSTSLEDVLKVLGEYNMATLRVSDTLLHRPSPPAWTNEKSRFLTRAGGFSLYSRDF